MLKTHSQRPKSTRCTMPTRTLHPTLFLNLATKCYLLQLIADRSTCKLKMDELPSSCPDSMDLSKSSKHSPNCQHTHYTCQRLPKSTQHSTPHYYAHILRMTTPSSLPTNLINPIITEDEETKYFINKIINQHTHG